MLWTRELVVRLGGVKAVNGVDLQLDRGEIVGLIGPNGAGKTTLLHALTGHVRVSAGQVLLGDREITRLPPRQVARVGIARTFQDIRIFRMLTVAQNLELAALNGGLRRRAARAFAKSLLKRFGLADIAERSAGELAQGDERRVGIARAVAARPTFLLLDEPAAGMNEGESIELTRTIADVHDELGCGVLLVEHDMDVVMEVCGRLQVLDAGVTIAVGSPHEIRNNPKVVSAYLGARRGPSEQGEEVRI